MTVQAYLRVLATNWKVVLAGMVTGLVAALAVTQMMPRVYMATTTMFVRGAAGTGAGAEYQAAQFAISRAKSYSIMIGNPELLNQITSDLNLKMGAAEVYARLTVENPIDTPLINVTSRGRTAGEAQALSQSAADNLAQFISKLESADSTSGRSLINVQMAVPAMMPTAPASPRVPLNAGIGLMAGLAMGATLAALLDTREPRRRGRRTRRRRDARPSSPEPRCAQAEPAASEPSVTSPGARGGDDRS